MGNIIVEKTYRIISRYPNEGMTLNGVRIEFHNWMCTTKNPQWQNALEGSTMFANKQIILIKFPKGKDEIDKDEIGKDEIDKENSELIKRGSAAKGVKSQKGPVTTFDK